MIIIVMTFFRKHLIIYDIHINILTDLIFDTFFFFLINYHVFDGRTHKL